jgi:hypothetical protein
VKMVIETLLEHSRFELSRHFEQKDSLASCSVADATENQEAYHGKGDRH